jgi:hypothetical protein
MSDEFLDLEQGSYQQSLLRHDVEDKMERTEKVICSWQYMRDEAW